MAISSSGEESGGSGEADGGEVGDGGRALGRQAAEVLKRNDLGSWTKAAPALYPHQWSWDSAFIALGLGHMDTHRAGRELATLFSAQWATGKVPHIVFNPSVPADCYFPDSERWRCQLISDDAPDGPPTSGLCQPPVHAIAARHIHLAAGEQGGGEAREAQALLEELYPRLLSWHRYLATARDPEGSGLVTIYHPWESGCDNSPRWDDALSAVRVGDLPPYQRRDLQHVADASQRPVRAEYDRYLWLVELLKSSGYDEETIYQTHPFLVKDVLFSALLVAANEALAEIGRAVGAPESDQRLIDGWVRRGRAGLESCWDADWDLCLDYDLRADRPVRVRTVAGFAPLLAGGLDARRAAGQVDVLDSPWFCGADNLCRALPPSTSPVEPGFRPRSYWRGPSWPVVNWLLWWGLQRAGYGQRAERLRLASLEQVAVGGFAEYFEPQTDEPLGSLDQSWTAAVTLDWLCADSAAQTGGLVATAA